VVLQGGAAPPRLLHRTRVGAGVAEFVSFRTFLLVTDTYDPERIGMAVKRLYRRGGVVKLVAENNLYPPIVVKSGEELTVWGVVTYNLHKLL
jgi:hypothetical protein